MNVHTWEHAPRSKTRAVLKQRKDHYILGPSESGILACGAEGAENHAGGQDYSKTLSLLP